MRGGSTRAGKATVLLAALGAAGCCGLERAQTGTKGNRDSPERAFAFVRDAFVDDRTGDQIDAFHQDFREAQGISANLYAAARTLRPGIFEEAASYLRDARIAGPVERRVGKTKSGPRAMALVTLETTTGARGIFVLADEPRCRLVTDDGESPETLGIPADMASAARIEGDDLVVSLRARLFFPPAATARVERVEIFHDWLLYEIRSLEGFGDFLEDVKRTAAESGDAKGEPAR